MDIKHIPNPDKARISFDSPLITPHPFRTLLVASSGAGKTTVMFALLGLGQNSVYRQLYGKNIFIISPTLSLDKRWQKLGLPKTHLYEDMDFAGYIETIIEYQQDTGNRPGLIIADDLLPWMSNSKQASFNKLAIGLSRHNNLSLLISTQVYKGVPKPIRLNMTTLFIWPTNTRELKLIWEEHSNGLEFEEFKFLYKYAIANKYDFLGIHYSNQIEERFSRSLKEIITLE